ncbi:MAG: hypothetical protein LBV17_00205, partial [Treponema sp.]|nr:hypothetical protein [Treponema sp.]
MTDDFYLPFIYKQLIVNILYVFIWIFCVYLLRYQIIICIMKPKVLSYFCSMKDPGIDRKK